MCLDSVTEKIDKPTTLIQSGWKEFQGNRAQPRFAAYAFKGSRDVPLDKWIAAEVQEIKVSTFKKYDAGFHIFEDEEEKTLPSVKRRVYYRKAHTRGRQNRSTVVIAAEMYVPSDPDAWPPQD
jgi:hypothetical protein